MVLPKHIADICGIVTGVDKAEPKTDFSAIQKVWDDTDGLFTIAHRGQTVGWVSEIQNADGPKYRALTVNNRIDRFYTFSQAMTWLLEESF